MKYLLVVFCLFAALAVASPAHAHADKTPELAKTKFKDLAKYLDLTTEQQEKVKPDVDRIQEIVKQSDKMGKSPGYGAGGRVPVGGSRWGGPGGGGNQGGVTLGDLEQRQTKRVEWQKEINNRVEEIKSFLTPEQREKFKTIQVPDIDASR